MIVEIPNMVAACCSAVTELQDTRPLPKVGGWYIDFLKRGQDVSLDTYLFPKGFAELLQLIGILGLMLHACATMNGSLCQGL